MRDTFFLIFFILFYSLSFSSTLKVKDLLNIAEKNNLQIQIAKHKYEIARAQTGQAWASIFPTLSLEGGYTRSDSYATRASAASFTALGTALASVPSINLSALSSLSSSSAISEYYSAKASITQLLFNSSAFAAIGASGYGLEAAKQELIYTKEDVYYNVLQIYLTIIQLKKKVAILEDSKKQLEKLLIQVNAMYKNGLVTKVDVLRTRSNLAGLKVSIINLNNTIDNMYNSLALVINEDIGSQGLDASIIDKLYRDRSFDRQIPVKEILKNRADYQKLVYTLELLKANIAIQEGAGWPSAVLVGSYGYTDTSSFKFDDANRDWLIAASVTWTLFDFGGIGGKADEARANYKVMEKQLELTIKGIENEIKTIGHNIKAARALVQSLYQEEKLNIELYSLNRSRYQLGEVTNIELLDAQNALAGVRRRLVEAKIDYTLHVLKWLKTVGKLSDYFEKGADL